MYCLLCSISQEWASVYNVLCSALLNNNRPYLKLFLSPIISVSSLQK